MIFNHRHIDPKFLDNKTVHKVTEDTPLTLLLSTKFTFLNDFIQYSLKISRVPFEVKETSESQVMSHQLPAIAFKDYILTQQNLVEFIADLMLNRETLADFTERKTLAKDLYRKIISVIKEQNSGLSCYSSLKNMGIQNEQDYLNHVCSVLFSMSSYLKTNILEQKYIGFRKNEINLETMMIFDIVQSILKLCQKTKADHILRSRFENLIDFTEEFKKRVNTVLKAQNQEAPLNQIQVVTEKVQEAPKVQYKKFSQNWKRFSIVFAIATAVYIKWVD